MVKPLRVSFFPPSSLSLISISSHRDGKKKGIIIVIIIQVLSSFETGRRQWQAGLWIGRHSRIRYRKVCFDSSLKERWRIGPLFYFEYDANYRVLTVYSQRVIIIDESTDALYGLPARGVTSWFGNCNNFGTYHGGSSSDGGLLTISIPFIIADSESENKLVAVSTNCNGGMII